MRKLMLKLWQDDSGIVVLECLLVATIVGLGLVGGLAAVEGALVSELTELANAIAGLDQSYSFAGNSLLGPAKLAGASGSGARTAPHAYKTEVQDAVRSVLDVHRLP